MMVKAWLNPKDLLQVNAFKSMYLQNRRLGLTIELSFAGAIEATSDEVFAKADPVLIKEYFRRYGKRKTLHRIRNQPVFSRY